MCQTVLPSTSRLDIVIFVITTMTITVGIIILVEKRKCPALSRGS